MSYLQSLIALLIPLTFAPGPGNLFFAALSARFGMRETASALAGYHLAMLAVTFIVGIGFEIGISNNPMLAKTVSTLGALYVLFLAWKMARANAKLQTTQHTQKTKFLDGVLLLILNPKAYVIMALLFSQFSPSQLDPANPTTVSLVVAGSLTLSNLLAFVIWIFVSDRLGKKVRSDGNMQRLNYIFGALLGVVALWLLISNWI